MTIRYSSAYAPLPNRPTLFESRAAVAREGGIAVFEYFTVTIAIGSVTGDIYNLFDVFANVPVASPQVAGVRFQGLMLACSANAGGTMTFNLGYTGQASIFGASLTTLQSATQVTVTAAQLAAQWAAPILQNNTVAMVLNAAGPTTTLATVTGIAIYGQTAP
jgi:hypothetical protein